MKKLSLAAIIVTVSISLSGCTNSGTVSNGNENNIESTTQNSTESNVQNSSESSTENNNVNTSQDNNTNNAQNNIVNNTGNISLDKAKEIALSHAGLSADQVTFVKVNMDFDDGIQKYEIEFYYNYREYSYEIDANTGNILSYEQD
ncbi:putative uncharacterized protein [Clostridium sp. CAG:221]|uniref:PepSY domain-containing protein n=1 Tax=Clostridium sp. CAG:221 TaxID=1262780 RepID=UPI000335DBFC|nr:PepSY domain-containing protein [Clostridium sp. CAG:221]CDB15848.1 putative uncharacterized protein [Clostridium sp. CAG:221]